MNLSFLGIGRVGVREGYPWLVLAINPCNIHKKAQKRKTRGSANPVGSIREGPSFAKGECGVMLGIEIKKEGIRENLLLGLAGSGC